MTPKATKSGGRPTNRAQAGAVSQSFIFRLGDIGSKSLKRPFHGKQLPRVRWLLCLAGLRESLQRGLRFSGFPARPMEFGVPIPDGFEHLEALNNAPSDNSSIGVNHDYNSQEALLFRRLFPHPSPSGRSPQRRMQQSR